MSGMLVYLVMMFMTQNTIKGIALSKVCCGKLHLAHYHSEQILFWILDFGFWAKEERDDFRLRAKKLGTRSEIVFMNVDNEELMKRVRVRNENLTNKIHYIPEEMMLSWIGFFQKPDINELRPREND